ncbi:MAG: UDP-N-acetylmuramoyl-L-alanine--D-glutamate ligase [Patescibacteria group bacterium]
MQKLKKLQNKKIALLGLGIENFSLAKFLLAKKIPCEITICDRKSKKNLGEKYEELKKHKNINWRMGKYYNKNLNKFDVLFRSPGWPLFSPCIQKILTAKSLQLKVTSPMQLFFEICPTKNIIGVTGTKGKGTTAGLIYEILKTGFERATTNNAHTNEKTKKQVWLGGNIGKAPFDFLIKIKKTDWVVLELSSFQLEYMTISPHISVMTNFYPEHLAPADPNNPNFHKTLADYWQAKNNIFKWQNKKDWAIINCQLRITKYKLDTEAKIIYFKKSELPSKLIGEHNKENIAAAVEVAKIIGINKNTIAKAVKNFKGLPHRLELVKIINGVRYYDDSFATTPESTIIALKSFTAPIVILLGGADKGANFKKLAKEVKNKVKFVILLKGDSTIKIKKELLKTGFKLRNIRLIDNIKDAVKIAEENSATGDVVLLSTACASFGMFKNYKERGELFKQAVNKIKTKLS